ncbi:MAG: DHH family phosphoesterase [Oscillospiraceae bacterium]|nr:DHH family phosphoesterase [Oscillospiraceae bacterium]
MKNRLNQLLRPHMGVYFGAMGVFSGVAMLMEQYWLGVAMAAAAALLFLFYNLDRNFRRKKLLRYLEKEENALESSSRGEAPFPAVMVRLGDGAIVWTNQRFSRMTGLNDTMREHNIQDLVPELKVDWLTDRKTECPQDVTIDGRRYRVHGTLIRGEGTLQNMLGVMYFSDMTELFQIRDEYVRSRPVVSIILVDNYEELTKNLTEGAISALNAKLNEAITQWTEGYNGILRRLERNRFLFIFEKRDLQQITEEKFSLIEAAHTILSPTGLPASISIGMGVDGASFDECYKFAALGIEMALSRGGDQAVLKDRFNFSFYGGRQQEADYTSRVKSRVKANSLMELIGQSSRVFIMGHKNADLDAVGAAMGVSCLCRKKGKKANIVIDLQRNASQKLLEEIRAVPEYADTFLTPQEALVVCDNRSVLIVVDTNRPDQVESPELLESISKICVIDHHRRAAEYIDPVVMSFHETYASSASELVTELLQYAVDTTDIMPIEIKSLMAGICLDTKSFNVRTGERTFEAAAFLRRLGADTVEVKKLLQNDFQDTIAKYQIIKNARLYRQEIAVVPLNSGTTRVLAAQAADELLNISGISASFVLYPDEDTVYISARSIGSANVQMILEPLGGGGNAATAGCQMKNITVKDALEQLVASIDKFYEE